jgi:hypothetical protein
MVEPGHFAVLCSERNLAGNTLEDALPFLSTTFDSLSIRLLFLNKAAVVKPKRPRTFFSS